MGQKYIPIENTQILVIWYKNECISSQHQSLQLLFKRFFFKPSNKSSKCENNNRSILYVNVGTVYLHLMLITCYLPINFSYISKQLVILYYGKLYLLFCCLVFLQCRI